MQTSYTRNDGRRTEASSDTLLAGLHAMGAPVCKAGDIVFALRARILDLWRQRSDPVAVSWDGQPASLELRLPASRASGLAGCRLELESGGHLQWNLDIGRLPVERAVCCEGENYVAVSISLPGGIPRGYHHLKIELRDDRLNTLVIASPRLCCAAGGDPDCSRSGRSWGVFLPLYALHSEKSWGAGDFKDLEELAKWSGRLGSSFTGTLPLLASFLDEPFVPSPYEPVSRLFWNELFLDMQGIEELDNCPEALSLLDSAVFKAGLDLLRKKRLVDYRAVMAKKRQVLELCVEKCFKDGGVLLDSLKGWLKKKPETVDYAGFRAAVEQRRADWTSWPDRLRQGSLRRDDYNPNIRRYHLYVQWLAHRQMEKLAEKKGSSGKGLYLDFPLGTYRGGYDVWRERDHFATGVDCGAPPDAFYTGGQNWGFPPFNPEKIRERGYSYYIACLQHHMRHTAILRLDHVMALHRLFWIPAGLDPKEGVYVRYRPEEFYAILCLESRRNSVAIVGENLGTVPGCVNNAMKKHGLYGMYVLPFEYSGMPQGDLNPVPAGVLGCLDTHDTDTFASFWNKKRQDPFDRDALPLYLAGEGIKGIAAGNTKSVLAGCLKHLGKSRAKLVLVNLEDLWLEEKAQNRPGAVNTHTNWRRKTRLPLEEFDGDPFISGMLRGINQLRKRSGHTGSISPATGKG